MACTCQVGLASLSELCESCTAEYLNICIEAEAEDRERAMEANDQAGGRPATLAEIIELEERVLALFEAEWRINRGVLARIEQLETRPMSTNELFGQLVAAELDLKEAA